MNILNFLDANVWLALLWSRHVHSEKARAWFERSSEEKFFFCRITQITVLRLLTTPMLMGNDVKTMAEAWTLWDKVCADDRIALLAEPEASSLNFVGSLRCTARRRRYGRMRTLSRSPRSPVSSSLRLIGDFAPSAPTCTFYKNLPAKLLLVQS